VAADDPTGPIYLLEVTPTALKSLNQYLRELFMRGLTPEVVRTNVSFDTTASFPKIQFKYGGLLPEETMESLDDVYTSDKVKEITGEAAPAVATPVAIEKPAPVKAEVVEEAKPIRGFGVAKVKEPEEAPAPKGRPKAVPKAEPVAAVADIADEIASLLGEIDADDA